MTTHLKNVLIFVAAMLLASCDPMVAQAANDSSSNENVEAIAMYAIAPTRLVDGTWRVRAINEDKTLCATGDYQPTCTVNEFDFSYAELDPDTANRVEDMFVEGHAVLDGWLEVVTDAEADTKKITLFVVEAWTELTDSQLDAPLYYAEALDIVCVRAPCPTLSLQLVNDADSMYLHGLDYTESDASDADIAMAEALLDEGRLLVAGDIEMSQAPTQRIPQPAPDDDKTMLTVDALYRPIPAR